MPREKKTPAWALDNVRFTSNAGDDLTCRQYLCELLHVLWSEQEGFSGKRPFGNSGWDGDIIDALADAKCIKRKRYSWGMGPDEAAGTMFVSRMIDALAETPEATSEIR